MTKLQQLYKYTFLICFVVLTGFILFFASFSGAESSSQSGVLLSIITSMLDILNINLEPNQITTLHMIIRKLIGHFAMFGLDGIFGYLTFDSWLNSSKKTKIIITLVTGLFIAGLSEVIQLFAPERGPSLYDVLLDFSGFILGVIFVLFIQYIHRVSSLKKVKG